MNSPTMLYRSPGPHRTDGVDYEYTIVDASEVEATLAQGWSLGVAEAGEAAKARDAAKLAANEAEQAVIEKQLATPAKAKKAKA